MTRAGHRGPRHVRRILAGVAALLTVGALAACTGGPPSAQPVADDLATGLSTLDLSDVPMVQRPRVVTQQMTGVVDGLGDVRPEVEAGPVEQDDEQETATTRLSFRWELTADVEWSYRTTADLVWSEDDEGWLVDWDPSALAPKLRQGETLQLTTRQAERTDILAADGSPIVTARPVVRVGIDKTQVDEDRAGQSARALAGVVDVDPDSLVERVEASGPRAFVEAIVLRARGAEPVPVARIADIEGAVMIQDEIPLAPTAEFARPVLGGVGEVTAELLEESDGRLRPGDQTGLSGLQARYDEQLAGTPGLTVQAVPTEEETGEEEAGEEEAGPRTLFEVEPEPGRPLRTTLEPELQAAAERLLSSVRPASALVAVRPSTGGIAVAASGPGGGGMSTATVGRYAPGSTFKVVTTLALLRAGVDPAAEVQCGREVVVDGKPFENYDDYPPSELGRIRLRDAVAHSCNTGFIAQRDQVTQQDLQGAAAALGLGVDHDLGFPVFLGSVPDAATATEHAASMIGQGRVEASPTAMAGVAASVAAGERVVPHLLDGQTAVDTGVDEPLTGAEAQALTTMLRGVVERGTGRFLADVPGGPVAAKTGTAEYDADGSTGLHAWMVAFQGDLAVAVFVADGESGSRTAGPLLERFLREAR